MVKAVGWFVGGLLISTVIVGVVMSARAQTPPENLAGVLAALENSGTLATIEFTETVPRLGKSVDIGLGDPQIATIGSDLVCFQQVAQSSQQITCVPYSNVLAVFYTD